MRILRLISSFDDRQKVAFEICDSLAEDQTQNVRVAASQEDCLANLTLICVFNSYRGFGMLAVVGPVNLDYQKVVSQLNVVNRVLTMKLTDSTDI